MLQSLKKICEIPRPIGERTLKLCLEVSSKPTVVKSEKSNALRLENIAKKLLDSTS